MSVVIGIDPHKGSHAAAAVDTSEVVIAELEVRATKRQARQLLAWAESFPTRRWAIESANGHGYLLAQQLVAAGEQVLDVPSTQSARVRVLDSTRSQKNDPNDARSVAIVALRQPGLRTVTTEDHVTVLRILANRHTQLSSLKTQAASRLHAVLAELIPGGLNTEMTPNKASKLLRRVRPVSMVETERKRIAHQLLTEVRRLNNQRIASKARLAVAVQASGTSLTDIYGAGPIVAALLIGHSGDQASATTKPVASFDEFSRTWRSRPTSSPPRRVWPATYRIGCKAMPWWPPRTLSRCTAIRFAHMYFPTLARSCFRSLRRPTWTSCTGRYSKAAEGTATVEPRRRFAMST